MTSKLTLDDVWPPLEDGLRHLLTKLTEGFSMPSYMKLYRSSLRHCTSPPCCSPAISTAMFTIIAQPRGQRLQTRANLRRRARTSPARTSITVYRTSFRSTSRMSSRCALPLNSLFDFDLHASITRHIIRLIIFLDAALWSCRPTLDLFSVFLPGGCLRRTARLLAAH